MSITEDTKKKVKEYGQKLRSKNSVLLDSGYLDNISKMYPGMEKTYIYDLRKVVEYNESIDGRPIGENVEGKEARVEDINVLNK